MSSLPPSKDVHILISDICEYVTLHSKTDFVDIVKDLERKCLSWMIWVGSNCNHMCPCRRVAQGVLRQKWREHCDQGGRDWNDVTSQRIPGATRS